MKSLQGVFCGEKTTSSNLSACQFTPQSFSDGQDERYEKKQKRRSQKRKRNRPIEEYIEASMRNHQRLPKCHLHFWAEHQCEQKRHAFIGPLSQQKTESAEEDHHPNIEHRVVHRKHADKTEKGYKRQEHLLGYQQDAGKDGNKGQIQEKQEEISYVHACDHAPEKLRMVRDHQRAGRDAVYEQRA